MPAGQRDVTRPGPATLTVTFLVSETLHYAYSRAKAGAAAGPDIAPRGPRRCCRDLQIVILMKTISTFHSLTRTLGGLQALPVAAAVASNLFRRGSRRRTTSSTYLIAGGVLAGAAAALLLNPWNGRELRSRVGKLFGGSVGKLVGEQVGGLTSDKTA